MNSGTANQRLEGTPGERSRSNRQSLARRPSAESFGFFSMRLRVLVGLLAILLAITCVIVQNSRMPTAVPRPSLSFQCYSNSPSGKTFAIVSVTNNDSCSIEFGREAAAYSSGDSSETSIWWSISNQTLRAGGSVVAALEVPPHYGRWYVAFFWTRHTLRDRLASKTERFGISLLLRTSYPRQFKSDLFPESENRTNRSTQQP